MNNQRLFRELSKLQSSPPSGLSIFTQDNKLTNIEAQIIGPENTPYKNGIFKLEIQIPQNYPFSPPFIRFLTKIYHPNIDENGRICLDLLKMPPKGNWRPTFSLEGILIAIRMLLSSPNPEDPLMAEIGSEYKNCYMEFFKKAEFYTQQYAK